MTTVGLIGLGSREVPSPHTSSGEGAELVVWNRSHGRSNDLVGLGARAAASPGVVLQQDISISVRANDEAVADVLSHRAGRGLGKTHICMASISPVAADRLI